MSEAAERTSRDLTSVVLRAFLLVAGAFVLVLLAPGSARAGGILDPVGEVAGTATSTVNDVTQATSGPVDGAASDVTGAVGQTVAGATGALTPAVGELTGSARTAARMVDETVAHVTGAITSTADGTVGAPPSSLAPAPGYEPPATAAVPHTRPVPHARPAPAAETRTADKTASPRVADGSFTHAAVPVTAVAPPAVGDAPRHRTPAGPRAGLPAGIASAPEDASRGSGGRGLQLAAILVAAFLLARNASRRLRLVDRARAPTPVISIEGRPG